MSHEDPIQQTFPLDAHDGPAPLLSEAEQRAMVQHAIGAVAGFTASPSSPVDLPLRLLSGTAVIAGVFAVTLASRVWFPVPTEVGVRSTGPGGPRTDAALADGMRAPPIEAAPTPSVAAPEDEPQPRVTTPTPATVSRAPSGALRTRAASDLLAEANRLRGTRAWRRAERVYRSVVTQHPSGQAAYAALVAAAGLRLDRLEDPRQALVLYRRAAARDGPLDDQVRAGVARALERLGRRQEAARAWAELASRHPHSPLAEQGRRRSRLLDGEDE